MLEGLGLAGLLLPLGMALGWYLARRYARAPERAARVDPEYLSGLSYLVNDDPDRAIAHFVRLVEVDAETVELHLMLGSLFRRRGEVDRALRLHQNLLARPNLPARHLNQARFELAQDHLKAGLLDRAEALFQDLVDEGVFVAPSLEALVAVYEQERNWTRAIEAARRLQAARGESRRSLIAHYYCELAEQARTAGDEAAALKYAGKGAEEDEDCVRAHLLRGALLERGNQFAEAAKAYRRAAERDPRFLRETLPALERCYRALGDADGYWQFLEEAEAGSADPAPVLAKARLMQDAGADPGEYLAQRLAQQPGWRLLARMLDAMPAGATAASALQAMREALAAMLKNRPAYRCGHCGLRPSLLFWQCPSCKSWGTIAPTEDVLNEP